MKATTTIFACIFVLCVAGLAYKGLSVVGNTAQAVGGAVQTVVKWPEEIASAAKDLFQAKTTITSSSITLQQENITELALTQRKTICITKLDTKSIIGTQSTVIIKGEFIVKTGYDLNKGCKVDFDEGARTVKIALPPATILSLETVKQEVFYLHEGMGNPVDPPEMAKAYAVNSKAARGEAEELGVTQDAELQMRQRVKDIFRGLAKEVSINEQPISIPLK